MACTRGWWWPIGVFLGLLLVHPGPVAPGAGQFDQVLAKRHRKRIKRRAPTPAPAKRSHVIFEIGEHIKGQTTSPGEVRVLERREPKLESMVKRRTGFQREIIQTVFPAHHR